MIIPERLKLVNYLSFEDEEFFFPNHPVEVYGENKTDDDQESNGSGKSGLLAGIRQAILNSNSRKVTDSKMIRRGSKEAIIEYDQYCTQREERLTTVRVLTKSGSKLELSLNGEPIEFSTVKDGNEYILEWMDSSKEDLISYYLIDNESFKSFFASSNRERLELIGRLSDTGFIDEAEAMVKEDVIEIETLVKETIRSREREEGRLSGFEEQLKDLESAIPKDTNPLIKSLEGEIDVITNSISDNMSEILKYKSTLPLLNDELEKAEYNVEECKGRQVDIGDLELALKDFRKELRAVNETKSASETKILGKINCPKCSHEFVLSSNVNISVEEAIIKECSAEIEDLIEAITICNEEILEADVVKKELRKLKEIVDDKESSILSTNRAIKKLDNDNISLKGEIVLKQSKIKQIREAKPVDNTVQIESLKIKIEGSNESIADLNLDIEVLDTDLFEVKQWETNFKRFKMYLANQTIASIQTRCNINLANMKSDLMVKIDGFKVKADGKLKEEITPLVVREEEASFFSYSGGEKARVQVAMILAMQDLINSRNKYGGINFLAIDEVLEGLDTKGVATLMKSIKGLGVSAMIITHVPSGKESDDAIVIEKINGISRIKK